MVRMKEMFSSLTSKGQVTIPKEIRELLHLEPHDKVAFVVEGHLVRLERGGSVVSRTAGALRSEGPPRSAQELRRLAEEAMAEDVVERSGG